MKYVLAKVKMENIKKNISPVCICLINSMKIKIKPIKTTQITQLGELFGKWKANLNTQKNAVNWSWTIMLKGNDHIMSVLKCIQIWKQNLMHLESDRWTFVGSAFR
jgi:hypothetical protein